MFWKDSLSGQAAKNNWKEKLDVSGHILRAVGAEPVTVVLLCLRIIIHGDYFILLNVELVDVFVTKHFKEQPLWILFTGLKNVLLRLPWFSLLARS